MAPTPGPSTPAPSRQKERIEGSESPVIPTSSLAAPPLTSIPTEVEEALPAKRVSFYVEAVEDMIKGVLVKESHLFTDLERKAMNCLLQLPYEPKYLFVRLYLRKFAWIRGSALYDSYGVEKVVGRGKEIADVGEAMESLWEVMEDLLPAKKHSIPNVPAVKVETEGVIDLTSDDDGNDDIKMTVEDEILHPDVGGQDDTERVDYSFFAADGKWLTQAGSRQVLAMLNLEELKQLACSLGVAHPKGPKSTSSIIDSLLATKKQGVLTSFFLNQPKDTAKTLGIGYQQDGKHLSQEQLVRNKALAIIGDCIRLNPDYISLLDRVSLLYHRKSISSSGTTALTDALLARFGKRTYPTYETKRTFSLFDTRQQLVEYEEALRMQRVMEDALGESWKPGSGDRYGVKKLVEVKEGTPTPVTVKKRRLSATEEVKIKEETKTNFQDARWSQSLAALAEWEKVKGRWLEMCREERIKSRRERKGKGKEVMEVVYYRRRFHPGWVLTRVAYKAAAIHARLGDHDSEKEIYTDLIKQKVFRRGKRGAWWDRLALLHERYGLAEEEEMKGEEKDEAKVARAKLALEVCLEGIKDGDTHLIYQADLRRRTIRLENFLKLPVPTRQKFDKGLARTTTITVEGIRTDAGITGKHSTWKARDEEEEDVSVEETALSHYRDEGWDGFHSENGVLTMIFALTFWDVLFAPIDGVFETPFQSAPLDLATDSFAIVRADLIKARRDEIEEGKGISIMSRVDDRERPKGTFCVGVNWEKYSKKDLCEIAKCIGGPALADLLLVYAEEYGHRSGGVPDLCLWNISELQCKFVEVKGPGDVLSTTQKVWIDLLLKLGIGVEVCKVKTLEMIEEEEDHKALKEKAREAKKEKEGDDVPLKNKRGKRKQKEEEEEL